MLSGWKKDVYTKDILHLEEDREISIGGYVQNIRKFGNMCFIILRDNTGDCQITCIKDQIDKNEYAKISELTPETIIGVKGKIHKTTQTVRGVEIIPSKIEILSKAETPLPLEIYGRVKSEIDTRLTYRSLDLRTQTNNTIFFIRSKVIESAIEHLTKQGYIIVNTPCIIGATSESGSDMFEVQYFDKKIYLRQDPQLHRQLTIAGGFEKIVDIGPSWRAEPSHTTKHLCEHYGIAVEKAFIENEIDIMKIQEDLIICIFKKLKEDCSKQLDLLSISLDIPKKPFPEIRYPEIYDILKDMKKDIEYGEEHDEESQQLLANYVKQNYDSEIFFINRFPFKSKPFYVMRVDSEPIRARSIDMIYKNIELSSGGQREHRYNELMKNVIEKNIKYISWFTDVFRYGVPPHGGFNIGIERLIFTILNLQNIRESVLFARDTERVIP